MIIQIDGTNTRNKGAELMLYSILEEIEKRYPRASVIFNTTSGSPKEINTNMPLEQRLLQKYGRYPRAILSRLKRPHTFFGEYYPMKNVDLVLDASGFRLGDQWNHSKQYLNTFSNYYRKLKHNGTIIILLPQAFGPFNSKMGKRSVEILNKYADLIVARESTSVKYLLDAGAQVEKIVQYPDFTLNIKGIFPEQYSSIKGEVCIIPNRKMITHGHLKGEDYFFFLHAIVTKLYKRGKKVFLLNHEAEGDLAICQRISQQYSKPLPIITGLNAKEIKGVIGASQLVISSRYHGVASALNQGVPCLATSWSHKYELLFKDFGLTNHIIDLNKNHNQAWPKIEALLDPEVNADLREYLISKKDELSKNIQTMWDIVWGTIN